MNNAGQAGLFYLNVNNTSSNSNQNISTQLCEYVVKHGIFIYNRGSRQKNTKFNYRIVGVTETLLNDITYEKI